MSLSLLPNDVLLEVLGHSKPLDILSLGGTCRSLHDLISDRRLWERMLRRLCTQRSLFCASYPPEQMDLGELQRAVSSHHKWENLVKRCSVLPGQLEVAESMESISKSSAVWLDELSGEDDVLVVPGGRYLVSVGFDLGVGDSVVLVRVLDLGLPGEAISGGNYVVSEYSFIGPEKLTNRTHKVIGALSVTGQSTLHVAVLVKRRQSTHPPWKILNFMITMLSLTFADEAIDFKESGTIHVTAGWTDWSPAKARPSIVENRVLVHLGDACLIWNFKKGWYQSWEIYKQYIQHEFIPFTGDLVIFPGTSDIAIWNAKNHQRHLIPLNAKVYLGADKDPRNLTPPDHSLQYPFVSPFSPASFLFTLSISRSFTQLPMVFDVLHRDSGMRLQLSRAPSSDGLDRFSIEFVTYYTTDNTCLELHRSWPREGFQLGFGSSSLVRPAIGRHYAQPFIYSLFPKGRTQDESDGEVWEGGSVITLAPVLPVDVSPNWLVVCSTSGRVLYRVMSSVETDDEEDTWAYWFLDPVY